MQIEGFLGRHRRPAVRLAQRWLLLYVGLFAACFSIQLHSQVASGITGTVTDQNKAVVVGASVQSTNVATGVSQHTVTSGAGTYVFTGLIPGTYTLAIEAPGFKRIDKTGVLVEAATQDTVDVTLIPGAAEERIEVVADTVSLNTTQPQLGTTIEPEFLNALPEQVSGRGRQIDNFQYLAPGVQGGAFVHEVSGGVNFQQEVVINGIPMPQSETEGMTTYINPPWELIQEARIERTTFAAQYGLAQGAVNYQTASGTNHLHGDAFEIDRNSSFDSKGFFNNTVPYDRENNYGFSLGGPVRLPKVYNGRDRTFFHFSSEWFRQNATVTGGNDTVPTMQERGGDFSDFIGQMIIKNPDGSTTTQVGVIPIFDPTTGQQFQYNGKLNVIPPGKISAASQALLQYLPQPNLPGSGYGGLDSNRAYDPYPNPTLNSNWGFTLDHNLTPSQTLHWTEWRDKLTTNQVFVTGPLVAPPNPLNSVAQELQLGTGFIFSYSNVLTPHLVMTTGGGWMGELNNESPVTNVSLPIVTNGSVMPQITFDGQHGATQWGSSGSLLNSINRKLAVDLQNNWLWTKDRHTFNIGLEVRRTFQDAFQAGSGGGHFSFSHNETSSSASDPNFAQYGSSFASFLLGLPDSANRAFTQTDKLRNLDFSPYLQDDIKLSRRLTVNAGVRWDIMVPFTAVNNNIAFLNPQEANPHTGGLPGMATTLGECITCVGWNRASIHWNHFGPRLGFAYELNDKTVLQAGSSLVFLNGGAYAYGDAVVADDYSNLLGGTYTKSSSGTTQTSYGQWDTNPMPAPVGGSIGATSGIASTIYMLSQNDGYAPYSEQWNVNIQRELPYKTFLTLAYIGTREVHIFSNINHPNQYPDSALALGSKLNDNFSNGTAQADGFSLPYPNFVADFGSNATVYQALKPFPQYADIENSFEGSGTVFYQGFQAQAEKRYTNGLAFLYSLTLARTESNNDFGNASGFSASAMDKYRQSQEYGVSSADQKYNTKLSFTYSLPIGKGQRWLNSNPVVRGVVGGLQVSGILDYEGGAPYGVGASGYAFQPNGFNRPNRVSSVPLGSVGRGAIKKWELAGHQGVGPQMFNPAAFADTGSPYVLGNAARLYSSLRGAPTHNENLSAKKVFYAEGLKFILQADFYNAFNRAVFSSQPDTNVDSGTFGYMTGQGGVNNTNRQGQGTLRVEF